MNPADASAGFIQKLELAWVRHVFLNPTRPVFGLVTCELVFVEPKRFQLPQSSQFPGNGPCARSTAGGGQWKNMTYESSRTPPRPRVGEYEILELAG